MKKLLITFGLSVLLAVSGYANTSDSGVSNPTIGKIYVRAGWWIDAIQLETTDGTLLPKQGGNGGSRYAISTDGLEKIRVYKGRNYVGQIQFIYDDGHVKKVGLGRGVGSLKEYVYQVSESGLVYKNNFEVVLKGKYIANLIVNDDVPSNPTPPTNVVFAESFENGLSLENTDYTLVSNINGASQVQIATTTKWGVGSRYGRNGAGDQFLFADGTNNLNVYKKDVDLVAGQYYELSFYVTHNGRVDLRAFIDGYTFKSESNMLFVKTKWRKYTFTFVASTTGTKTISIVDMNGVKAYNDFALDDIKLIKTQAPVKIYPHEQVIYNEVIHQEKRLIDIVISAMQSGQEVELMIDMDHGNAIRLQLDYNPITGEDMVVGHSQMGGEIVRMVVVPSKDTQSGEEWVFIGEQHKKEKNLGLFYRLINYEDSFEPQADYEDFEPQENIQPLGEFRLLKI